MSDLLDLILLLLLVALTVKLWQIGAALEVPCAPVLWGCL